MKKKYIYILIIIYIITLSTGIFIEVVTPATDISMFSQSIDSFLSAPNLTKDNFFPLLFSYLKDDFLLVLSIQLLTLGIITMPIAIIILISKVFSLGFSAAFIASVLSNNSLLITLATILPRAIIRIPLYFVLTVVALKTSKALYLNRKNKIDKNIIFRFLYNGLLTFICLAIASLIEVCLLLSVL